MSILLTRPGATAVVVTPGGSALITPLAPKPSGDFVYCSETTLCSESTIITDGPAVALTDLNAGSLSTPAASRGSLTLIPA